MAVVNSVNGKTSARILQVFAYTELFYRLTSMQTCSDGRGFNENGLRRLNMGSTPHARK
jgi:hypothetical protein